MIFRRKPYTIGYIVKVKNPKVKSKERKVKAEVKASAGSKIYPSPVRSLYYRGTVRNVHSVSIARIHILCKYKRDVSSHTVNVSLRILFKTFKYYSDIILPKIGHWIEHLKLNNEQSYPQLTILSLCTNLQTLTLLNYHINDIESYVEHFSHLINLKLDLIQSEDDFKQLYKINLCKYLFSRTSLLEKLSCNWIYINKHIRPCKIEELYISLNTFSELIILFNNLPRIRIMHVTFLNEDCNENDMKHSVFKNLSKKICRLIDFSLTKIHFSFENDIFIVNLLRHLPATLKRLSLEITLDNQTRLTDGYYLQRDILSHFSQLIEFDYALYVKNETLSVSKIISTFQTKYWFVKKWLIGCHYNEQVNSYCLRSLPFSSEWIRGISNGFLNRQLNSDSIITDMSFYYKKVKQLTMYAPLSLCLFKLLNEILKNISVVDVSQLENDSDIIVQWLNDEKNEQFQFKTIHTLQFSLEDNKWNMFRKRLILYSPNLKRLIINYKTILKITNHYNDVKFHVIFKNIRELILADFFVENVSDIVKYFINVRYLIIIHQGYKTKLFKMNDIVEIFILMKNLAYIQLPFNPETLYNTINSIYKQLELCYDCFYVDFIYPAKYIQIWK
ncbi:unnamed protein product [Didymodactylos carnosus]|uniref:Uncharacterized protein n=2 Tax=Didymodactylos carnosus TaxID=1234261 RepID=A0A814MDF1_9BILA|nr:unnamed protein product [Didymodactylos carnosus]CAF3843414.1 unnamed protein product [Didymodactylos carnosus]